MNKHLQIPYQPSLRGKSMEQINALIDDLGGKAAIDQVNWEKAFPYMPLTTVYIARTDEMLYIKWRVRGSMLKAVYTKDLDPVWKDSCVEFFCQVPDSDYYINLEFNCIGTSTAAVRRSRQDVLGHLTADEFQKIERYASLGRRPFCEIDGHFRWELCIGIPFSLLLNPQTENGGIEGLDSARPMPRTLRGNFYKCADDTSSMHYVSWNPIHTENPDFHRPEDFGELIL